MWWFHRWPVNSPHKGPVSRKNVFIWWRHHDFKMIVSLKSSIICYHLDSRYLWWCLIWGWLSNEACVMIWHCHDDVIKWKHFPRYWPFVPGIHRSPVNSLHKGQWGGALMFSLICTWINGSVNNREAGDLRRHRAHYDVMVMATIIILNLDLSTFEAWMLNALWYAAA